MHIKLRDNIRSFKKHMSNGTIYFEYSDGYRIAVHRSLYSITNTESSTVYRDFIDRLTTDYKVRKLVKMYYKVENPNQTDPGYSNVWVNLLKIMQNNTGNLYNYAWNYRNTESFHIDIKDIKSVKYIDKAFNVFNIDYYDGNINNGTKNRIIKLHTRDKRFVEVSRYNLSDPTSIKEHLKDDIRIKLKDTDETVDNTLVWINGRFVETMKDSEDNKIMYIFKGIGALTYQHLGFIGNDPLTPKHIPTGFPVASFESDPQRMHFGPGLDINIFKWKNVKISEWYKPHVYDYDHINYRKENEGESSFEMVVDYINSVTFTENIPESHIIIHNGIIIDRNDYDVDGKTIRIKSSRGKAMSMINSAIVEYGQITSLPFIVESFLPKGEDFRLITFSHNEEEKTIKLNRSVVNYKNHPYPFHVSFEDLEVGDIILLDGIYERYLLHDKNVIKYPYTDYMARYYDRNLLNETKVERLYFSEI